ncbi:MAG: NADH:ubiquinone oxidoreductase subunit J [Gammaproteobacteria bacterium]|nr:MAG: NADH:ubiquinone oxidoreductase subunit J [Gammaproteobacteria bacterium]
MHIPAVLFYALAALALVTALGAVGTRHPVHAVLYLAACLVASAGLWLLLEAEFLALVLVLVYVGAVVVLFLFVVMMLDVDAAALRRGFVRHLPLAVLGAALVAWPLLRGVGPWRLDAALWPAPPARGDAYSDTLALAQALFGEHLLAFELAGVLLLVAIVAAIALARHRRRDVKRQDPAAQAAVRPAERLRLLRDLGGERRR